MCVLLIFQRCVTVNILKHFMFLHPSDMLYVLPRMFIVRLNGFSVFWGQVFKTIKNNGCNLTELFGCNASVACEYALMVIRPKF